MKKQGILFFAVRALARQLQSEADFLFRFIGEEERLVPQMQPRVHYKGAKQPLASQGEHKLSSAERETPPADWLARSEIDNPPAHWLTYVQQATSTSLPTSGQASRQNLTDRLAETNSQNLPVRSAETSRQNLPSRSANASAQKTAGRLSHAPRREPASSSDAQWDTMQWPPQEKSSADVTNRTEQHASVEPMLALPSQARVVGSTALVSPTKKQVHNPAQTAQPSLSHTHATISNYKDFLAFSHQNDVSDKNVSAMPTHVPSKMVQRRFVTQQLAIGKEHPFAQPQRDQDSRSDLSQKAVWQESERSASHEIEPEHTFKRRQPPDGSTRTSQASWSDQPGGLDLSPDVTPLAVNAPQPVQRFSWSKMSVPTQTDTGKMPERLDGRSQAETDWPSLPDETMQRSRDWHTMHQDWAHQQRLDNEQRGIVWNV